MRRLLPAIALAAAVWPAIAAPSAAPTFAEMLDTAYCDGWHRAQTAAKERGQVIRALFKDDDRWRMVQDVLDLGECPRGKATTRQ